MDTTEYEVRPALMRAGGTGEPRGYVAMVAEKGTGHLVAFAIYDGDFSGKRQELHATPDLAMEFYEGREPLHPHGDGYKRLLRRP